MTRRYVAMGVSGCGKSLIGALLADRMGMRFVDGDDLHPQANIAKMHAGHPLTDGDRAPWLDAVGAALGDDTVIACSALRRIYRDRIRARAGDRTVFLYLSGSRAVLWQRVSTRPGHFMPAALLDSQIATLEDPAADERSVRADIDQAPGGVVADLMAGLSRLGA